jgi:hypothetical protein
MKLILLFNLNKHKISSFFDGNIRKLVFPLIFTINIEEKKINYNLYLNNSNCFIL